MGLTCKHHVAAAAALCLGLGPGCVSRVKHEGAVQRHAQLQVECAQRQALHRKERAALETRRHRAAQEQHRLSQELRGCRARMTQAQSTSMRQQRELERSREQLAKVMHDRAALKLEAQQIRSTYAELRARATAREHREHERAQLRSGLAGLEAGGHLTIETRGEATVLIIPMDPLFSLGAAQLSSAGLTELKTVGRELRATYAPHRMEIQVQGHTDNVPKRTATIRNNWELSAARALAVVERFIEAGLDAQDLSAAAFGPHRPRVSNATGQGRAANRRIEVVITRRRSATR